MSTPPDQHSPLNACSTSGFPSPNGENEKPRDFNQLVPEVHKRLVEHLEWQSMSPVGRLFFDPLALIFELCAEMDWKSSLRIAAVSKCWRAVILETPRAWCSVDARSRNGAGLLSLYSDRCSHIPLQVTTYADVLYSLLVAPIKVLSHFSPGLDNSKNGRRRLVQKIGQTIGCMSISNLPTVRRVVEYSSLTRLRITRPKPDIQLSNLSTTRFPALRHLETTAALYHDEDFPLSQCPDLPRLQTLKLTVNHNPAGIHLIKHCRETLVSLSLMIRGDAFPQEDVSDILLPQLQCLQISTTGTGVARSWRSAFRTPSLTTYIELNESGPVDQLLHDDIGGIIHLRLNQSTIPSHVHLTELATVQLDALSHDLHKTVDQLTNQLKSAKRLRLLEVHCDDADFGVETSETSLDSLMENADASFEVRLVSGNCRKDLPGVISYSVRFWGFASPSSHLPLPLVWRRHTKCNLPEVYVPMTHIATNSYRTAISLLATYNRPCMSCSNSDSLIAWRAALAMVITLTL